MPLIRGNYNQVTEIPFFVTQNPYRDYINNDNNYKNLALMAGKYWAPFLLQEVAFGPKKLPKQLLDPSIGFVTRYEKFKSDVRSGCEQYWPKVHRIALDVISPKEGEKYHYFKAEDFWTNNDLKPIPLAIKNDITRMFFPGRSASPEYRMKLVETLSILENYYYYDPKAEEALKKQAEEKQKEQALQTEHSQHIARLNNELSVLGQENSILKKNIDFLKETKNSFNQLVTKTIKSQNELNIIKESQNEFIDKLHRRMRKRMMSNAPEIKASYNFFSDIFESNK